MLKFKLILIALLMAGIANSQVYKPYSGNWQTKGFWKHDKPILVEGATISAAKIAEWNQLKSEIENINAQITLILDQINSQTTPMPGIYVSTTGNNTTGTGTYSNPYLTIEKALEVAVANDVIRLLPGTYTISSQIDWYKQGVDLIGAGSANTVINCNVAATYAISSWNASLIDGGHIFSGIHFNGQSTTGFAAIQMVKVNNVSIHDCKFTDFSTLAVYFGNSVPTVTYATGNRFYNNIIDNSSLYQAGGSEGALGIKGQDGFLCYGNSVALPKRGATPAGFGIKTNYTKRLKVYNNSITCPVNDDNSAWVFAMELWNTSDECEIYNNTFGAAVDFAGDYTNKGSGAYSVKIYDNNFGQSSLQDVARVGLLLECEADDLSDFYVFNNTFKNLQSCISIYTLSASTFNNIYIYRNTFSSVGVSSNTYWGEVITTGGNSGFTINNLYIDNNTLISGRGANSLTGIVIPTNGTVTNVYIRNNIVKDFGTTAITSSSTASGTINSVFIQNNIIHGCGASNEPAWGGITPGSITKSGTIKSDPLFVSTIDFTLQAGSPAINAGLIIATPYISYLGSAPDCGAFEKQ